jgi:hypothetical protein
MVVNMLKRDMAELAHVIDSSLAGDQRVSIWEGIAISMQGVNLAKTLILLAQKESKGVRKEIPYVLENAVFVLPD